MSGLIVFALEQRCAVSIGAAALWTVMFIARGTSELSNRGS
jgi:hypothetical protein